MDAQKNPGVLATCLMAWARGEEETDAQAGAFVTAEFMWMVREALTKR